MRRRCPTATATPPRFSNARPAAKSPKITTPVTTREGGVDDVLGFPGGPPGGPTSASGIPAGDAGPELDGIAVGDAGDVGVAMVEGVPVAVGDGVPPTTGATQLALVIVLVSKVTAPFRASNRPWNVAPV